MLVIKNRPNHSIKDASHIALPQSEEDLHAAHERQCAQPENGNHTPPFYSGEMSSTSDHAEETIRSMSVTAHASSQAQEVDITLASHSRRRSRKFEHHRPDDLASLLHTVVLVRGWTTLDNNSKDSWRREDGGIVTLECHALVRNIYIRTRI
jgi:hypothetical protein